MNLNNISTEDLKKELEKREAQNRLPKPKIIERPTFDRLRVLCQSYVDGVDTDDLDDDLKEYIFEAAMEAFFGDDYWEWNNLRLR